VPLRITTEIRPTQGHTGCSRQQLREHARAARNPFAARATNVGVTVPHLAVHLRNTFFDVRTVPPPVWGPGAGGSPTRERRLGGGVLTLVLDQTIFLLDTLTPIEQRVWAEHEQLHVADNEHIVRGPGAGTVTDEHEQLHTADNEGLVRSPLAAAVMTERSIIAPLFLDHDWVAEGDLSAIELAVAAAVENVFMELTAQAARARDTAAEYHGRMQQIRSLTPARTPSPRATRAPR
jgi:hypothetical protein